MKNWKVEKKIFAAIILLISVFVKLSGQGAYLPPDKPRLVIGIVVEQLKYDQLEKFRDRFGENGIKRLLNEGPYFKNASFEYMLTQSAPGHATISTGSEPSFHGITSDNWYLPLRNELIYCTDCHASNGTGAPAGPHGSIYPSILKYRYDKADNTSESSATYELCYKCHSRTSIIGNNSFGRHSLHIVSERAPCNTCHDPHGINFSQGNSANNSNLINFDRGIVSPNGSGVVRFVDTGTNHGYCLLSCHGKTHDSGMNY